MPMEGGHSDNNHSNDNHNNGNKSNGNHRDGNHSNSGDSSDSDSDSDSKVAQFPVALTFSYLSLCCCSNFLLFMFWRKAFVLVVFD